MYAINRSTYSANTTGLKIKKELKEAIMFEYAKHKVQDSRVNSVKPVKFTTFIGIFQYKMLSSKDSFIENQCL